MIYQYRCLEHGIFDSFEELFSPNPAAPCPICMQLCDKIISIPTIRFVGSGWTVKDKSHEFEQRFPDLAQMAGDWVELADIFKACGDYGIAVILALVVIYWNRKDSKEHTAQEREDKLLLMKTLQENTQVLAELKTLVQRLNGKDWGCLPLGE